ncbi:hypothetical protein, partial [Bacillus pseudomycoides]
FIILTEKTPSSKRSEGGGLLGFVFFKENVFLIERTFVLLYNDLIKQNEVRTGEESVFFETDL